MSDLAVEKIEIMPAGGPLRGTVRPPGSKSITNRALVCAALAEGTSTLREALESEDTEVMIDSLERLGISIGSDPAAGRLTVVGCGGRIPSRGAELFVGNSGTTIRFLAALVAIGKGTFRLRGVDRMHERPIADLVAALAQLGVDIEAESPMGCPPVTVRADGLRGGQVAIRGDVSSQFVSGLLMAAPYAAGPLEISIDGPLVSAPYVEMTLDVMRAFGVLVTAEGNSRFRVATPQTYRACEYMVEPDASAASYFWAAAAITGGSVKVSGLSLASLQGDVAVCDCLVRMGCRADYAADDITLHGDRLHGIEVDMNAISDMVPTLAVVALFADGPTTIRGVAHIRHKETDRLGSLAVELRKLGANVDVLEDGLRIVPGPLRAAELETYNDHRMAMGLALSGLVRPGIVIRNPACVAKTYPRFFEELGRLAGAASRLR